MHPYLLALTKSQPQFNLTESKETKDVMKSFGFSVHIEQFLFLSLFKVVKASQNHV